MMNLTLVNPNSASTKFSDYQKIVKKCNKNFDQMIDIYFSAKGISGKSKTWLYDLMDDNTCYDFFLYIPKLAGLISSSVEFKSILLHILENKDNPTKLRFFAFFCYFSFLRLNRDFSKAKSFVDTYSDDFQDEIVYHYARSLIKEFSTDLDEIEQGIQACHNLVCRKELENNIAMYQFYANSILIGLENDIGFILSNEERYIAKALDLILKALAQKKYAKYYFTYGKLLFYSVRPQNDINLYKKAKRAINRAIDIENSAREDYSLRLLEYQSYLTRIDIHIDYSHIQQSLQDFSVSIKEDVLQNAQQFAEQFGLSVEKYIENLIKVDTEHHQRHHAL